LRRYIATAEAALAAEEDPWTAFAVFMRRCLDDGAGSLTLRFAGSFTATDELHGLGCVAHKATQRLLDRIQSAGILRTDITVGDISLLLEQLQAVHAGDQHRSRQLRHRYLMLLLDALHTPSAVPLPGPAPSWEEIGRRFDK